MWMLPLCSQGTGQTQLEVSGENVAALALPWTPASSTQRSVLQTGVEHTVTALCHDCAGLGSIVFSLCGVISHPGWAGDNLSPVTSTSLGYKLIFIQCQIRDPQAGGGFTDPFGSWLSGFGPFHPMPRCSSPLCLLCW